MAVRQVQEFIETRMPELASSKEFRVVEAGEDSPTGGNASVLYEGRWAQILVSETHGSVGVWFGSAPGAEDGLRAGECPYPASVVRRFLDASCDAPTGDDVEVVAGRLDEVDRIFAPEVWAANLGRLEGLLHDRSWERSAPLPALVVAGVLVGRDDESARWSRAVDDLGEAARRSAAVGEALTLNVVFWRGAKGRPVPFSGTVVGVPNLDSARLLVKVSLDDFEYGERAQAREQLVGLALHALPEARRRAREAGVEESFRSAERVLVSLGGPGMQSE